LAGTPHHVVIDPSGRYAYVALNGAGRVAIVDLPGLAEVGSVALPAPPHAVALSPSGDLLFVTTFGPWVYKVATAGRNVVDSLTVGAAAFHVTVRPNDAHVFASVLTMNSIVEIDPVTFDSVRAVEATEPQGMAFSPDGGTLYIASDNGSMEIRSATSGALAGTVPLPGPAFGIARAPDGRFYISQNGFFDPPGIGIFDPSDNGLTLIPTWGSPRTVAYDVRTNVMVIPNEGGWVHLLR
jgi:DNA-binding beta-propeller fold protein YncE